MHRTSAILILALLASATAWAGGDAAAGKTKSQACAGCHGPAGVSVAPTFPHIAGQYADYIVHALKGYKTGKRDNPIMKGQVANLSEKDMEDLAAYFSQQPGLSAPHIK